MGAAWAEPRPAGGVESVCGPPLDGAGACHDRAARI